MEQAWAFRGLELRVVLGLLIIALALVGVKLPHQMMLMQPPLGIRLLIALRGRRVLDATHGAWCLSHSICGAL